MLESCPFCRECSRLSAKPNILLLLSDDQAWGDYGFMGHPQIETPALDRLAGESILYTRGYSPVPLCRPSLAALTTGLYPHQHGVTGNDPDLPVKGISAMAGSRNPEVAKYYTDVIAEWRGHPDLLESLKAAGYVSLQTGKWWEGNPVADGGFTAGMTHGDPKRGGRHGDEGLKIGREGLKPIKEFIDGAGDKPWFVWYAVFLPHSPHTPPAVLLEKYRKLDAERAGGALLGLCRVVRPDRSTSCCDSSTRRASARTRSCSTPATTAGSRIRTRRTASPRARS